MSICLFTGEGAVFEPVRNTVRALFPNATMLSADVPSAWAGAVSNSDLVVVDATAANPLAFYFLGLADAFGRRSIIITAIAERLPAPFQNRPTVVHGWNLEQLKSDLGKFAPANAKATPDPREEDPSPAGKFHKLFGDLLQKYGYEHRGPIELDGAVFTVREQDMDFALVQEISNRAKTLKVRVRLL